MTKFFSLVANLLLDKKVNFKPCIGWIWSYSCTLKHISFGWASAYKCEGLSPGSSSVIPRIFFCLVLVWSKHHLGDYKQRAHKCLMKPPLHNQFFAYDGDAILLKIVASLGRSGWYTSYVHHFVAKSSTHWISHNFFCNFSAVDIASLAQFSVLASNATILKNIASKSQTKHCLCNHGLNRTVKRSFLLLVKCWLKKEV